MDGTDRVRVNTLPCDLYPPRCSVPEEYRPLVRQQARFAAERAVANERVRHERRERERASSELEQRTERLQILREIDQAILEARSPRAIARAALRHVRRLVPCLGGVVAMLDPRMDQILVLVAEVNDELQVGGETHLRLSELWWARSLVESLQRKEAHQVVDLDAELRAELRADARPSPATRALRKWGLRALLNVPLVAESTLIGFLSLGKARAGPFAPAHVDLALDVAQPLAIAIQQARLFEQVHAGRERLRQLARQLVAAQEDERRRLARALHDEAGQALTALKISLDLILNDLRQDAVQQDAARPEHSLVAQRIADAASLAEATQTQLRALAHDLRPPALDIAGLNSALKGYCRQFAAHTRMSIVYEGTDPPALAEAADICLYRFLQEALTNVAKHACASQVRVELCASDHSVQLSVEDNGRGFDHDARLSLAGWPMGIGLLGMQERLEALGGRLEIGSQANRGARLVASLPTEGS